MAFLFTDLEGSTALLEAHPDAYREAVARHHTLLRGAVEISVSTVLRRRGPIGASAVVVRLRHFATVFGLSPYCRARARVGACDAWSSARIRGVVRAQP